MPHRSCLALGLLALGACSSSVPPLASDHHAVISAVLQDQPDIAAERRRYFRAHPEEASLLSHLFDYRFCVESRTAGRPSDFEASTIRPFSLEEAAPEARWDRSRRSFPIADEGFPRFLRRASLFSICPSGTLRISNPRFEAQTARIFVELRCRGWCGGGGELILRKHGGRWEVQEWAHQWTS